ncbi:allantoicase [Vibrio lamellibrachiae]|uniref:allantoicase n=1 Tax=Vibrio lamellibrachiae TaxID=2910253 RepID=UPI003D13621B
MTQQLEQATGFQDYTNLADERLGAEALFATDDFFADKSRMLRREAPEWKDDVYDDNGKWMDGWESRRKRGEGYDYCVVKLGLAGTIAGVDIDTTWFTGNFPPSASLDACFSPEGAPSDSQEWDEIIASTSLQGDKHHLTEIDSDKVYTHVRLNIYPDGGVARLRIYGRPSVDWDNLSASQQLDFAAVENGGRALACSDEHYGTKANILGPGRGENMGDGWETARRRTPGNDWVIVALGHSANIERVVVDTAHFKGNFPDSCSIQAAYVSGGTDDQVETQSLFWRELLPAQKLSAHELHEFNEQVKDLGAITHVRLNIFPDGGISRLRLFGTKASK